MWSLMILKYNASAQSLIKFQVIIRLDNCLVKHTRNLYNFKLHRSTSTKPECNNVCFNRISRNISSICKFSTTNVLPKSKDRGKEKKKSQPSRVDLREMTEVMNAERMMSEFDKAIDDFKDELIKHVGLRTSVGALEDLTVKFEGDEYKLQELAEINRKPKMIVMNISAFPQTIPNIIETLQKSQMNLNPQQEGTTLYIPIPKVTKEYREQLAKSAKAYFVKCKDNINDVRNKHVKSLKKKENLPSDVVYRVEGYISTLSHDYVGKADKMLQTKQKELLGDSE